MSATTVFGSNNTICGEYLPKATYGSNIVPSCMNCIYVGFRTCHNLRVSQALENKHKENEIR